MKSIEKPLNLLEEPLFEAILSEGGVTSSLPLPGILENLCTQRIQAFPALQVHQSHAWYAFLVQLAAMAIDKGMLEEWKRLNLRYGTPWQQLDQGTWKKCLLALTDGAIEPWCLVVQDPLKPAFMQAPAPEGSLKTFKKLDDDEADLDILVLTKNHDIKINRMARRDVEQVIYGLITIQTLSGYSGYGNYGIARMNSGLGSRPCVTVVPRDLSLRFQRDLYIMIAALDKDTRNESIERREKGHTILWTIPWDGKEQLDITSCHPYFLEICRRLRLTYDEQGDLAIYKKPTQAARINAIELQGNTGDPWTPVNKDGKALTVSSAGFHYRLVQELLLSGNYQEPITQQINPLDNDIEEMYFFTQVLIRWQRKTEGYFERRIPLPHKVRDFLSLEEDTRLEQVANLSQELVNIAANVEYRVLAPAIRKLSDPENSAARWIKEMDSAARWIKEMDHIVDDIFFEFLWESLERDKKTGDILTEWKEKMVMELAYRQLQEAIRFSAIPDARRFEKIVAAERIFWASARKNCPEIFNKKEGVKNA